MSISLLSPHENLGVFHTFQLVLPSEMKQYKYGITVDSSYTTRFAIRTDEYMDLPPVYSPNTLHQHHIDPLYTSKWRFAQLHTLHFTILNFFFFEKKLKSIKCSDEIIFSKKLKYFLRESFSM